MNRIMLWLEKDFAPKMDKVNHNIWVMTIKDSIMQILPFIFLGSVFSCLAILNEYVSWLPDFWGPHGWTMGMVSLFISCLIPYNYFEKKKQRRFKMVACLSGLILFLICITPEVTLSGTVGFNHSSLGAGGMFVAIITGCITSLIFDLFRKFSLFKEDSMIPDFVRDWFDFMIPVAVVVCLGWIVVLICNVNFYRMIVNLFLPLQNFMQTWYGITLMSFLMCFFYSMGISTWVFTPINQPVFLMAIAANLEMVAAGTASNATLNFYTNGTVYSTYLWIGGLGATLPLAILLLRSKTKKLKSLGKASIFPSLLNINEPLVFSCIAWNPLLMVPMWICGIVLPLLIWFFTKVIMFAPLPHIQFELWYCPFPICTWISTQGSISALILVAIVFAAAYLIYYPFFKIYEKREYELETKAE